MNTNQNQEPSLEETWNATALLRPEANQKVFEQFLQIPDHNGHVLNCAVPRERARSLTNVEMPQGWEIKNCFPASIGLGFGIDGLKNWKYNPKICYREQLPYLHKLPVEHADLAKSPWFQSATPARGMAINARLLRYNHDLWHAIKPRMLQDALSNYMDCTARGRAAEVQDILKKTIADDTFGPEEGFRHGANHLNPFCEA